MHGLVSPRTVYDLWPAFVLFALIGIPLWLADRPRRRR
jgi:hypothetical protein